MATKPKVKLEQRKPVRLAYIEHVGPYDAIPYTEYMERLYGWAKEAKVRPGFYPMGIFHDSPEETPPKECRSEIAIPIAGKAKSSGDIRIRDLPAMRVAAVSHKGPSSDYPKTYEALNSWVAENGYEVTGPPMEVYSRRPERVGGRTILYAKVMAPVRKK